LTQSSLSSKILSRNSKNLCRAIYRKTGIPIKRAYDVYLEDVEGNRYLDFSAGGTTAVGYSHPKVIEAVVEQAKASLDMADLAIGIVDLRNDLAEEVKSWVPTKLAQGKIAFGHSGSDIVEKAIRVARFATSRPMIISCFEAHHGASPGALSASPTLKEMGSTTIARFFQLPGFLYMPYPDSYRPWFGVGSEAGKASLAFLERLLSSVVSPELVAGIIVEPILSYGGNIVPPDGYFQGLAEICHRNGIPLISDEVLTGIGKTGRMFALEHWDVWPNILCLGKALSGSVPLSLLLAEDDLAEKWRPEDEVGMSKGGHLVGCAMAVAILRIVREEKLVQHAEKMGHYMIRRMQDLKEDFEIPGQVRGLGLLVGFDLVENEATKKPASQLASRVVELARQNGLIFGIVGAGHNVLRFTPSLTIREEHIDSAAETIEQAFKDLRAKGLLQ
jgi:4-aminobutyrate aminotransferase-like enzyme